MDDTFYSYLNSSIKQAIKEIESIIEVLKKYNSTTTILFHNSMLSSSKINFVLLYEYILTYHK